jgi:hypothetical protein
MKVADNVFAKAAWLVGNRQIRDRPVEALHDPIAFVNGYAKVTVPARSRPDRAPR